MVDRRREDVDDAAAHGVLATAGDHVDTGVGEFGQTRGERLDLGFVADGELDRRDLPESLGQGLEERADGGDDERECAPGLRVGEAAEDLEALTDSVRARGELLVRQGLPAGEDGDRVGRHPVGQRPREVLGLPGRGGDDEPR